MPDYAYLKASLKCPFCSEELTDMAIFQWGYCPAADLVPEYVYQVGDKIFWKTCSDGSVPAWTYFQKSPYETPANIGEPGVLNLVVKDNFQNRFYSACQYCLEPLGGVAVHISDGFINKSWICKKGELDQEVVIDSEETNYTFSTKVTYYSLAEDGTAKTISQWEAHFMEIKPFQC